MAQLEEEKKHLEYMNSIKKYDIDQQVYCFFKVICLNLLKGYFTNKIPQESDKGSDQHDLRGNESTLQELGFGPEEDEEMSGKLVLPRLYQSVPSVFLYLRLYISSFLFHFCIGNVQGQFNPTPAHSMAASASAGYEIPARLRTLHNLVSSTLLYIQSLLHSKIGFTINF